VQVMLCRLGEDRIDGWGNFLDSHFLTCKMKGLRLGSVTGLVLDAELDISAHSNGDRPHLFQVLLSYFWIDKLDKMMGMTMVPGVGHHNEQKLDGEDLAQN